MTTLTLGIPFWTNCSLKETCLIDEYVRLLEPVRKEMKLQENV